MHTAVSYHTGYRGSQAAQWELCSSPELVWWRGQSPEVRFLEWWEEEGPVEHTGLLGVCQNCNLLGSNDITSLTLSSESVQATKKHNHRLFCYGAPEATRPESNTDRLQL